MCRPLNLPGWSWTVLAGTLVLAAGASFAEEATQETPQPAETVGSKDSEKPAAKNGRPDLPDNEVTALIEQLASDSWLMREDATKTLSTAGRGNLKKMHAALKDSDDPEVRERLSAALRRARVICMAGIYKQIEKITWNRHGLRMNARNDEAEGTLSIAQGKVIWAQSYDGDKVTQVYALKGNDSDDASDGCEAKIEFKSLTTGHPYHPDDTDTKIVFDRSAEKLRVVLHIRDEQGQNAHVTFERQEP